MKNRIMKLSTVAVFTMALAITPFAAVGAVSLSGCDFDDSVAGTWTLQADCTSTAQINIPVNTTLDGDGYTISPNFARTNNSNNSVLGVIGADNVTIKDLTIDGVGGTNLHGVNVYVAENVVLENVTSTDNDRSGVVVNGSNVTVEDITTAGNGWHGINVAQGGGVTDPAVLTVNGQSSQTDAWQIYLDDTTQNVTVNDVESQYLVSYPVTTPDRPNDKLYTLKQIVTDKAQCKANGWQNVYAANFDGFKNQGQCVAYVSSSPMSALHKIIFAALAI
ncbi:MAG: right-handed parallel beta-helix repeat-containing protein [Candidatus Saccharimonadaceae bacterium]